MYNIVNIIWERFKSIPDQVAVITQTRKFTYRDLNDLTNQYLSLIINTSQQSRNIIALYFSRSIHYLACTLAVLKSGSSFLPLDKGLPVDRLHKIIEISGANIILGDSDLPLQDYLETTIRIINESDMEACILNLKSLSYTFPTISPKDLAYIIFTSGSTGFPKGVMISHESLAYFCKGFSKSISMQSYGSILALTNFAFDISIVELLGSLTLGMRIILVGDREKSHPRHTINLIQEYKPDIVQLTPSYLMYLKAYQKEAVWLNNVKLIIIGGEKVTSSHLQSFQDYPHVLVFNAYGPTEATVWFSVGQLSVGESIHAGVPIESMSYRIINDEIENVENGELLLTGPCLSLGYINDKAKTNEQFCMLDGKRYYRTGDIATLDENGNIIIIGRYDNQVKRFGHRIELEDIEENIIRTTQIKQCVVVLRDDELFCYYLSNDTIKSNELYAMLSQSLPQYMIPKYYTRLSDLPLSSNGKIDRKMLSIKTHKEIILLEINKILSSYIKIRFNYQETFSKAGIDSIDFVRLLVELEEKFDFEFDDNALALNYYPNIQNLIDHIINRIT